MADASPAVRSASIAEAPVRTAPRWRQLGVALPYLIPAAVLMLIFDIWPIFFGFWISLWKWGVKAQQFIGVRNYVRIFTEEIFTTGVDGAVELGDVGLSLLVTSYYVIFTVPVALAIAFLLANLLFQKIPARGLYRTIFFLPYVTSQIAAAMVFRWIFHPEVGVANVALKAAGLPPQTWLLDPEPVLKRVMGVLGVSMDWLPDYLAGPSTALLVVIIFSIWASVGFDIIIFLAGLGNIPKELYEAARVDGAEGWTLTRRITLPLLSPTTFFLLVVSVIRAFQNFNAFFALSGAEGDPMGTTLSVTLNIFRNFYARPGQVGFAAAISFLLFFIILALTILQFRAGEKRVHYG